MAPQGFGDEIPNTKISLRCPALWAGSFTCVFVGLGLLNTAAADNSDSKIITETASYQGLHPDEFMKTWFILGPIPIFQVIPLP